jgi:hypothetical protein
MNFNEVLQKTTDNPVIEWIKSNSLDNIKNDIWALNCITNNHIGAGYTHGYFTILHNIVKSLQDDAVIVELGSREAMSDVAIIDALKDTQQYYSVDIIYDYRYLNMDLVKTNTKIIIADCLEHTTIEQIPDGIDLLFLDTIHTYDQVKKEYDYYRSKLNDGCIILIDDIKLNDKGRFFHEVDLEKYDISDLCHNVSGFGALIYRK